MKYRGRHGQGTNDGGMRFVRFSLSRRFMKRSPHLVLFAFYLFLLIVYGGFFCIFLSLISPRQSQQLSWTTRSPTNTRLALCLPLFPRSRKSTFGCAIVFYNCATKKFSLSNFHLYSMQIQRNQFNFFKIFQKFFFVN